MILKLKKSNVVLKTKDKYLTEDIQIVADSSTIEPSSLKTLLDDTKSVSYLFSDYTGESVNHLINYNDTENVTHFYNMFSYCQKLTSVPLLNTSKGTNFDSMFNNSTKLTSVPPLDTSNGTNFRNMFSSCPKLQIVPQINTNNATSLASMFSNCYTLPKVDITHFNFKSTSDSDSMFSSCYTLKAVIIRSFGNDYVLNSNAFNRCYHILGTYDKTYNPNSDKDGYIYIPRDMIPILSQETNWSTLAEQFRALEDYTHDGTCWGEFDDAKAGL